MLHLERKLLNIDFAVRKYGKNLTVKITTNYAWFRRKGAPQKAAHLL
jgi:hypothetical protein